MLKNTINMHAPGCNNFTKPLCRKYILERQHDKPLLHSEMPHHSSAPEHAVSDDVLSLQFLSPSLCTCIIGWLDCPAQYGRSLYSGHTSLYDHLYITWTFGTNPKSSSISMTLACSCQCPILSAFWAQCNSSYVSEWNTVKLIETPTAVNALINVYVENGGIM